MIKVSPEQLITQLRSGLRERYLLWGNEPLLLQESRDAIRHAAQGQGFDEHFTFSLEQHTDWDAIFSVCRSLSLFAGRQTLTLYLPENGPNAAMGEQLLRLAGQLHPDLLLILRGHKLTKAQENSAWFKALAQDGVYIACMTPELNRLPQWVTARAALLQLQPDEQAVRLLCYCYEGNLLALSQALSRLALIYPDGKLTLPRVEAAVNDAAHFTPYHWVDALLAGKSKRACHILTQLLAEDNEPVILLRTVQREVMQLLTLQRESRNQPLRTLFDKHRIWQNRRDMITEALDRLDAHTLQVAISLITRIEIRLKQDYGQSVSDDLLTLTLLLSGKAQTGQILYDEQRG
ncbi:DNA polymerase III subunit delta [Morganella morganii]|uniref:DNA polymerase III subunit delta n=1 Tax=Morganella morganii TaxID=582 RepID=UPI003EB7247E